VRSFIPCENPAHCNPTPRVPHVGTTLTPFFTHLILPHGERSYPQSSYHVATEILALKLNGTPPFRIGHTKSRSIARKLEKEMSQVLCQKSVEEVTV
jgi:hypothetical protein